MMYCKYVFYICKVFSGKVLFSCVLHLKKNACMLSINDVHVLWKERPHHSPDTKYTICCLTFKNHVDEVIRVLPHL